jgi:putative ATP-binding cassette transporter
MAAPGAAEWMVLPQKPYLALGSLRDQLLYTLPPGAGAVGPHDLERALIQARLEPLLHRYPDLEAETDWEQVLSGGEQQRLGFARVMLDEATSALDLATEEHLYGLLRQARMAVISVGHRPSLMGFHQRVLRLDGRGGWSLEPC